MIKIETIRSNIGKVSLPETLKADDFRQLAPQADMLIQKHGKIRLLLDASKFNGWENVAAFEQHMDFVKVHHQKVERIALIAGHSWQHLVASLIRMFVHPDVKAFDKHQEKEALQWLSSK